MKTYHPFLLSLLISTTLTTGAFSQTSSQNLFPDFSPEERSDIERKFGTYSSATAVFTGRNAASTGNFQFDGNDANFQVTNIPLTHTFGEDGDMLRFQLRGAFGHFSSTSSDDSFALLYEEIEDELPSELQGLPNESDFRKDSATSVSLGGGVLYEPIKNLRFMPSFDFIWTHVKRRFDYNNFVSQLLSLQYDRDLFNNSTQSITYSPSFGIDYKFDLGDGYWITPSVLYTYLRTVDIWSKSQYADFSINSDILQTKLEVNIPVADSVFGYATSIRPFVTRTGLFGAVRESIADNELYDVGANAAFTINNNWLKELTVGAAYIFADDFDGYRLHLGFDF